LGAAGNLGLDEEEEEEEEEVWEMGRREEDSLRGRMRGWPLSCCWRLASRASIFICVDAAGGGGNEGLGARERDRGGETLLRPGEGERLSCCAPTNPVKSS
jgi:hypothetical protein